MDVFYRALSGSGGWPAIDEHRAQRLRAENLDLLTAGLLEAHPPAAWPASDRATLAHRRNDAIARELLEARLIADVLSALDDAGCSCLILKGAAVARTHYGASWWRYRGDIDLLVPADALSNAEQAVATAGWTPSIEPADAVASGQRHYQHRSPGAPPLDLHVRLFAPVLEGAPSFDDLWRARRDVPGLECRAFTLADADALWYACLHIALHHTGEASTLWLYDVDRLARGLFERDWSALATRAARSQTRTICAVVLARAADLFGTPVPESVRSWHGITGESTERFLHAKSELRIQWLNLCALGDSRARLSWLRAHLLPEQSYMRARYRVRHPAGLATAYLHRAVSGALKWVGLAVAGRR